MRLWCHVHPRKRELTNFHIRNFRVDYTAVFDMSSNVTGNSQYCRCSSLCTVHPLQKGPVRSDLSKQLVWHVAQKTWSSLPVVFTSLEGPQEDFLLLWWEIPSTYRWLWWVLSSLSYHLKCNSGRNADGWESSAGWTTGTKAISVPWTREPAESLFLTAVSTTKGQVFRIDTYFCS